MTEENYTYQIVEFVRPGPKTYEKSVDFVPSKWINFNAKKGKLLCKFLPPPYDEENSLLLHNLVQLQGDAPEDWPEYTVEVKGGASKEIRSFIRTGTYEEALERLNRLNFEEYAFTHESDVTPQEKAQNLIQKHKRHKLKVRESTINALKVSDLQSGSEEEMQTEGSQFPCKERIKLAKPNIRYRNKKRKIDSGEASGSKLSNEEVHSNSKNKPKTSLKKDNITTQPIGKPSQTETSRLLKFKEKQVVKKSSKMLNETSRFACITLGNKNKKTDFGKPSDSKSKLRVEEIYSNTENEQETSSEAEDFNQRQVPTSSQTETSALPKPKAKQGVENLLKTPNKAPHFHKLKRKNVNASRPISDSAFLLAIYKDLQEMKVDLKEVILNKKKTLQVDAESEILRGITEDFTAKHNVDLPLQNKNAFDEFNIKLLEQADFREDFMRSLSKYFDPCRVVSRSLTNILKKHLSRTFAMQFTVSRKVPEKFLMKNTGFYDCLLDVFIQTHKDKYTNNKLSQILFDKELGRVMGNSKDWDGFRSIRGAKQQVHNGSGTNDLDEQEDNGSGAENSNEKENESFDDDFNDSDDQDETNL